MGCMAFTAKCISALAILCLILLYVPGIPPDVTYSAFTVDPALARTGPLGKNYILDEAERLYEGYLRGPESIASRAKNEIFVSLHEGKIARIWGPDFDKTEIVATIGPGCAGPWEEKICGRPLGLRFTKDKSLLVADSYLGIFSVDVTTGKKEQLVDAKIPINGATPKIVDDLDVDDEGNIYWSDASSKYDLSDGLIELLSDPSGRLLKFDPKTKKNKILIPDLHFANGVQLSPDQKFVLVVESFKRRVVRYWLKGPKAGKSEVFISGLPGSPDNIRPRKEGGYYISIVLPSSPEAPDFFRILSAWPGVRKIILRATFIIQKSVDIINSYYPNVFCANFIYKVFHLGVIANWMDHGEAMVVEVDEQGKVVGSLQGSQGVVRYISETHQVGDYLFFGSPWNNYLGRLHISKKKVVSKGASEDKDSTKKKEEL